MAKKRTEPVAPRKRGRPSQYSNALAERICDAVADGLTLQKAAEAEGIPRRTVRRWIDTHPAFSAMYARAREWHLEVKEDRLTDITHALQAAWFDCETGSAHVQALRAEADIVKWQLVKMLPKKYGDKAAVELTGAEGAPLMPAHTREELAEFAALLAQAETEASKHD